MSSAAVEARPWPSPRTAWTLTLLLTLAYVFSFIDRWILGLLVEPIKADLQLSDASMGLLLGPAFGLLYAVMGVPLGWAADRFRRTWLVAAGVALWSIATVACGLARSFGQLFAARMSVGIGEATLSPAAMSMIADSFPPEKRGQPIGVYQASVSLGSGIAALIGAAVLTFAQSAGDVVLPLFGEVRPWQLTFIVVGLPGLLIALGFLFVGEPLRRSAAPAAKVDAPGFGAAFAYVGRNFGAFGGVAVIGCVMTIIAYAHGGFMPSMFKRTYGWEPSTYAFVNGVITLAIMPATVSSIGGLCDRLRGRGMRDAAFRMHALGLILMVPFNTIGPLMPSPYLALPILVVGNLGIAAATAAGTIALLEITPAAMRGQIVAFYYMAISISGLMLGPTTVGWLSSGLFGEGQLRYAVAATPLLYGILPLLALPLIRRAYARQLERTE